MTLSEAIASGNELEILTETRRLIAAQLEQCDNGHDLSSLSDKMVKISERITELEKQRKPKQKTALDSIRKLKK